MAPPPSMANYFYFLFKIVLCGNAGMGKTYLIWDTAGRRDSSPLHSCYHNTNALILIYNIAFEEFFRCFPEWLKDIEQHATIDLAQAKDFSKAPDMYYLEIYARKCGETFSQFSLLLDQQSKTEHACEQCGIPVSGEVKNISCLICCNFN
uniref:Uncharacterized protein n=1 Tax=Pelusios castaneus TaxID=367368 RepID=A0A8C8RXY3_9SAUR